MRYAIIADIHSNTENLEKVLKHISSQDYINEIICLGDIFDCKISKSELKTFCFRNIEQIVKIDFKLLSLLKSIKKVIGNQEERIRKLIPTNYIPDNMIQYINAPQEINIKEACFIHGHHFEWLNPSESIWYPKINNVEKPLLIYGHNHQNALFQLKKIKKGYIYKKIEIRLGKPIRLNFNHHYLVNIGDIRREKPSWALLDTKKQTIQYYQLDSCKKNIGNI